MLSRITTDSATDLGSAWLHASQQSASLPWQVSAAGLATFIHVCVGSMICFLSHDGVFSYVANNPSLLNGLDFDKKACDVVYLQPGDALLV